MRIQKLTAVLLGCQLALALQASAGPVWYQQRTFSANASGTLGGAPFSGATVELSLYGDTSTVVPYTVQGVSGAENLVGISTVTIYQPDGGVLTATFLPSAGVYVGVDQTNAGVGFGSSGVAPSAPTFPGQPMYPVGLYVTSGNAATYDLTTQASLSGIAQSCVDFPVTCNAALPLATTAGDLVLDAVGVVGLFNSYLLTQTGFSRFTARGNVTGHPASAFSITANLTLGGGNDGLDLAFEYTRINVGPYLFSLVPGALAADPSGGWTFSGTLDGVALTVHLQQVSTNGYSLSIQGSGPLVGMGGLLKVDLTLGNDRGSTTVVSRRHHDD